MAIGYLVLTLAYYKNSFNARDLVFMSTSLFGSDGSTYNQSAILTPENRLDPTKLEEVGLPRFTATYAVSQITYNLSLGAALVHVLLWNWNDLKAGWAHCYHSLPLSSQEVSQLSEGSNSSRAGKILMTSIIKVGSYTNIS